MMPDDFVLPFEVKPLGVRGRVVRLGAVVDDILHRHAYPAPVSALLGEAVALTAMLGTALKFDGKFILQTKTDGAADMIVADFVAPGGVRGYAHYRPEAGTALNEPSLLGQGHLAMTIDQGPDTERYQGIVPLQGSTLTEAAHVYFTQSEQIPTRIKLASGHLMGKGGAENWRAGAIMVQHLPDRGRPSPLRETSGDAPPGSEAPIEEDDRWVKARLLLDTAEDHELLDPLLTPEELLYRLFHEDGVTVYRPTPLERHCSCSRQRIGDILGSFTDAERRDMARGGIITVTCEFCSSVYEFPFTEPNLKAAS
jgi:molecular chaperone Hsp33